MFLRFAATVLLVFCSVRTVVELLQLIRRRKSYLTEVENYLELLLICSTIIFASAGQAEACFCLEDFQWEFGALAVFLAWIDLVLHLKKLPLTAIPINMLQSIVITFLKLMYLPLILIVAFALPFYMLFSRVSVLLATVSIHAILLLPFSLSLRILLTHQDIHC